MFRGWVAFEWKANLVVDSIADGRVKFKGEGWEWSPSSVWVDGGNHQPAKVKVREISEDVLAKFRGGADLKSIVEGWSHSFGGCCGFVFPGKYDLSIEKAYFNAEAELMLPVKCLGGRPPTEAAVAHPCCRPPC